MSLIRKTLVNIGDRIQLGNFDTAFVITVKTDNTGTSADNQIMLPIQGTNMVIDWRDGTQSVHTQTSFPNNTLVGGNNVVHTYSEAGTYNIRISKEIELILFDDDGDKDKILSWRNCGVAEWTAFGNAFRGCSNLQGDFLDTPDLSSVTVLSSMFRDTPFNQDISGWDVSNVEQMGSMFFNASAFNQDIGSWNVSNVQFMNSMFRNTPFNQDIGGWDVGNVSNMESMFRDSSAFNQDIGSWNTGNVTRMDAFLLNATSFNQSLEDWEIESINSTADQSMFRMLDTCGMSTENYSRTLIGWANYVKSEKGGENLPANVILGATGREYDDTTYADVQTHGASDPFTDAVAARAYLVNTANWDITGDTDVS